MKGSGSAGEGEPRRLTPQDGGAASLRADGALGRKALRIGFACDGQEVEDGLAVAGGLDTVKLRYPRHLDVLGLDRVEEFAERLGQPCGLLRGLGDFLCQTGFRMSLCPVINEVHEKQELARLRDRRAEFSACVVRRQQVLVDIADGPDARQEHAAAAGEAEENILKLAHGAAGGKQDGPAREIEAARSVTVGAGEALQDGAGKNFKKRLVWRDGEDARRLSAHRSFLQRGFGERNGIGRSDMKPAAEMREAEKASLCDGAIPQEVHRELSLGCVLEEAGRNQIAANIGQWLSGGSRLPGEAAIGAAHEIARSIIADRLAEGAEQEETIHRFIVPRRAQPIKRGFTALDPEAVAVDDEEGVRAQSRKGQGYAAAGI